MSVLCWRAQWISVSYFFWWGSELIISKCLFFCLLSDCCQTGKLAIWSYTEVKHIRWLFFSLEGWLLSVLVHVESDWQRLAFVANGLVVFAFECDWFWWSIWNNVEVFFVSSSIFILPSDLRCNFLYLLSGFIYFVQTASLVCVCVCVRAEVLRIMFSFEWVFLQCFPQFLWLNIICKPVHLF